MVKEESRVKCGFCGSMMNGNSGEVVCFFQGQPQEKQCPYKQQPALDTITISDLPVKPGVEFANTIPNLSNRTTFEQVHPQPPAPLPVHEPSSPTDKLVSPSPSPATRPSKRRGLAIFLFIVIILLLVGSGVLADYTLQLHTQILSLNSKIIAQAVTIQNQNTAIQRGQATQRSFQATWTAIAMNNSLGAIVVGQSKYPTLSFGQSSGQSPSIFFTLLNTGTSTWSDQDGFSFTCTSSNHSGPTSLGYIPTCLNQGTLTFVNNATVPTGSPYTFSFTFTTSSLSAGSTYATYWQLAHNGQLFGPEVYVRITITN